MVVCFGRLFVINDYASGKRTYPKCCLTGESLVSCKRIKTENMLLGKKGLKAQLDVDPQLTFYKIRFFFHI